MVNGFVDTAILVDILRGHPPAKPWLAAQTQLGITPIVWLELIEGARTKITQRQAMELLSRFQMIYLVQADMDWAMQQLSTYKLSHNIGMLDSLIASVSHRLQMTLYTNNLKHFSPLLGNLAQKPY
jgi:predicted nucleic acid-binding protein